MLEIHEGKDKASDLKQEIIKKNKDARVEIINKIGNNRDVTQAIRSSVDETPQLQDINAVSIRPTQYGSQNATVVMKNEWVKEQCRVNSPNSIWQPKCDGGHEE
ncbi:hypothetical protein QE152_g35267 [Popillia japonica]|uniref:Uncharacterized protein n=1 Tax=Popillia japonica TaxID=7064 RepID=A0AAW1IGA7_POPJA